MGDPRGTTRERVLIVSASVGAGHDGAARELAHRLERRGVLTETRDFLDALPAWMRYTVREGYTQTVNRTPWFYDWLYSRMERPGAVQRLGLLVCRLAERGVRRWCEETRADAVVSTYPLASQALGGLVRRGRLTVPTSTFLTDPSVHALWVHPHVHRHLTTMPATSAMGERDYGTAMTVAGPLVPQRFAAPLPAGRRAELLAELGHDPARPLALVVTGSLGLGRVVDTVDAVVATGVATPLVLCGRNERLLAELAARPDVRAFGWRTDMHELMQVCDVLVHNAGGLSFSESLVAGLPAVTYACIPGHGKANGDVLAQAGVAPLADTVEELRDALRQQLLPAAREAVHATVAAARHDASAIVLSDLRARGLATDLSAARTRRTRRTARRRVAAVGAAALVALSSVGATEGVSAATRHGIGVTRMPVGSVAVVVAPTTLAAARADVERLRRSRAAVLVPDRPTAADLAAARTLGHAGIPLLTSGCPSSTLLHHTSRAQWCGASVALAAAGVPVTPVVVSNGPVDALDLVVARRDGTRILIAARARPARAQGTGTGGPTGDVWLLRRGPGDSAARLATDLGRADDQAGRLGLRLGAVTEARPGS